MHVVVFTRSTPDTAAKVEADASGKVSWGDAATVVNPWDEYALEEAILQASNHSGKASVIAIGPELHDEALKYSLGMGMKDNLENAIRVWDPALENTDSLAYATAAAGAVNKLGDVDLVIFGKESIDVATDQHIYQTGRKLGWPVLSAVSKILDVDYAAKTIRVERMVEQGKQVVTSKLPVVISVTKDINEPRYPSFMGIRKAAKVEIPVWSLDDLGVSLPPVRTTVAGYTNPPVSNVEVEMIDGTPEEQAAKLVDRLLEDKVL